MVSLVGAQVKTTPIVLYDGGCGFCGWSVRLVLRHDSERQFRFAPLDGPVAGRLLAEHRLADGAGSVVVIDDGVAYLRSDAVLRIVRRLGRGWHLLRMGVVIPRPVRDGLYCWVARHRGRISRLLGTRPIQPEERAADDRFLA